MAQPRYRSAVSPLRRPREATSAPLPTVDAIVARERPEEPLHCLRPARLTAAAREFVTGFPGETLYAVKCNPEPSVLRRLWAGGVRRFDCASIGEVRLVRTMFPEATIHFMHPVKPRSSIREAWANFAVQDFSLDSGEELAKIREESSGSGPGPGLFVRVALPHTRARLDLSGKFGASRDLAIRLLRAARPLTSRLGVCFHVGSQCLEPEAWSEAVAFTGALIREAGVPVEVIDVGGGFPVDYPDMRPPPLTSFFDAIANASAALAMPGVEIWAEPGRALVASGGSVVVQVHGRRGDALFINDGTYGALSDAGVPGFVFPVRLIRPEGPPPSDKMKDFVFFGPTCDSADRMNGPFPLPADVREGDWIEIGQLGSYGTCLRTAFNGFDRARLVEVAG